RGSRREGRILHRARAPSDSRLLRDDHLSRDRLSSRDVPRVVRDSAVRRVGSAVERDDVRHRTAHLSAASGLYRRRPAPLPLSHGTCMNLDDLKRHLVDICHCASERWLTAGSGGNISVRIPNTTRYLCTATGVTFRDTAVENVVEMDLDGRQVSPGPWKPSK